MLLSQELEEHFCILLSVRLRHKRLPQRVNMLRRQVYRRTVSDKVRDKIQTCPNVLCVVVLRPVWDRLMELFRCHGGFGRWLVFRKKGDCVGNT
jgi:hypothetical protein